MKKNNLWDDVADDYEGYSYHGKDNNHPANKYRAKIILNFLSNLKKGKILDAGCGTGYVTRKLLKLGWDSVGIDLSKKMLEFAKHQAAKEGLDPDLKHCSVLDMGIFDDREFDVIMLNGVLPYIDEKDEHKAYKECNRLLRDDGYLIIAQYNAFFDFFMEKDLKINKLIDFPEILNFEDRTMKYENPLTYKRKIKKYNFIEEDQFYYNFHNVSPALTTKKDNLLRKELEEKLFDRWQGLFMAKTFISISKKI